MCWLELFQVITCVSAVNVGGDIVFNEFHKLSGSDNQGEKCADKFKDTTGLSYGWAIAAFLILIGMVVVYAGLRIEDDKTPSNHKPDAEYEPIMFGRIPTNLTAKKDEISDNAIKYRNV